MGEARISTSSWRLVEVGRVVLFNSGPHQGRLAAIVEIIDHKRVLVDNPAIEDGVHRHAAPLADVTLTWIVLPKLPRAIGTGPLKRAWEKAEVDTKWSSSVAAKNREQKARRRQLNDFERFKVMRLKKQSRYEVRKSLHKGRLAVKSKA